jgi:hypothetical protein
MDKEGYVPLDVIGRFNRVRALTQSVPLIREVISDIVHRGHPGDPTPFEAIPEYQGLIL